MTYYVNFEDGDDNNDGKNPNVAFKTMEKARSVAVNKDDVIISISVQDAD